MLQIVYSFTLAIILKQVGVTTKLYKMKLTKAKFVEAEAKVADMKKKKKMYAKRQFVQGAKQD